MDAARTLYQNNRPTGPRVEWNFPYVTKEEPSQSVTLGLTYTRMSVKTVIVVSFLLNIKLDSDHVRASW